MKLASFGLADELVDDQLLLWACQRGLSVSPVPDLGSFTFEAEPTVAVEGLDRIVGRLAIRVVILVRSPAD